MQQKLHFFVIYFLYIFSRMVEHMHHQREVLKIAFHRDESQILLLVQKIVVQLVFAFVIEQVVDIEIDDTIVDFVVVVVIEIALVLGTNFLLLENHHIFCLQNCLPLQHRVLLLTNLFCHLLLFLENLLQ